jgi:hypothetical protein
LASLAGPASFYNFLKIQSASNRPTVCRKRNNRPSASIVSQLLSSGVMEKGCCSRLIFKNTAEEKEKNDHAATRVENMVMAEIADFLEMNEHDEYWSARMHQSRAVSLRQNDHHRKYFTEKAQVLPTLVARLASVCHLTTSPGSQSFDATVQFIAMQLLAACYTLLPATSADNLPLLQQRTRSQPVSALRLHSYYRYSPAAGYHARDPSGTSPWPGLYSGPTVEGERVDPAIQRTSNAESSAEIPRWLQTSAYPMRPEDFSRWNDGPADDHCDRRSPPLSESPPSTPKPRLVSRLVCQPSASRGLVRKALYHLFREKDTEHVVDGDETRPPIARLKSSSSQGTSSPPVISRIPSPIRFQVRPSTPKTPTNVSRPLNLRRISSNPTMSSPMLYNLAIPEIRRISASTAATNSPASRRTSGRDFFNIQGHLSQPLSTVFDPTRLTQSECATSTPDSNMFFERMAPYPGEKEWRSVRGEEEVDFKGSSTACEPEHLDTSINSKDEIESSSDDSIAHNGRRRRYGLGNAVNSGAEISRRLEKRTRRQNDATRVKQF